MSNNIQGWQWKDSNVVDYNRESFISASRCVVYAQVAKSTKNQTTSLVDSSFYPIGLVQSYNWNEQRQVDMIFELGSDVPFLVPGRTTGQLSISRMMLYGRDLINVLYNSNLNKNTNAVVDPAANSYGQYTIRSLKDIDKPLNLMFAMFSNDYNSGTFESTLKLDAASKYYSRVFRNCWITSRGESLSAGQTVVAEQVSIIYEDITRVKTASN